MQPRSKPSSNMFGLVPMTEDFSMEQPDVRLDDSDELKKKRISKSKQWKEVKEQLEARRAIYTRQLPGGALFRNMTKEDAAHYSAVADCVIEEIDGFIGFIEGVY